MKGGAPPLTIPPQQLDILYKFSADRENDRYFIVEILQIDAGKKLVKLASFQDEVKSKITFSFEIAGNS